MVDFGAGVGTFAKRLRNSGANVICIEPDASQQARLQEDGFEVLATVDSLRDNSAAFIFSLNVLEHIEDDQGTVRQIYRKLEPGGCLLIYVPAFNFIWSSLDDKVRHHRRYTKKTLRRLVEREGLAVERLEYVDSLGFIVAFVFRLLRREVDVITSSSVNFYDRWIFPPSRVLDVAFRHVFGKNVFVMCRK